MTDYKDMSDMEIASMIAKNDFQSKKLIEENDALKKELLDRGNAGKSVVTRDGKITITFTDGIKKVPDMDKACDVLGTENVGVMLQIKREGVTLALSDFPANIRDKVCREEKDTVRMYIKRRY